MVSANACGTSVVPPPQRVRPRGSIPVSQCAGRRIADVPDRRRSVLPRLNTAGMEPGAWKRPSPRLRHVRHIEALAPTAAGAAAAAILLALEVSALAAIGGALAVLVAGAVLDVLLQRRVGAWGYLEREDDLLVRRGVLVCRLSVVPYGRMQFIDVRAGPLERGLGLATVHMHTAAAASDARIPGLERDEAARLRDRLAELGEAQAAGL